MTKVKIRLAPISILPRLIAALGLLACTAAGLPLAATAQGQSGPAVSRSFTTVNQNIVAGALVATRADNAQAVELATASNARLLVGIVSQASLVELRDSGQTGAQVVVSGTAAALVSDINGPIRSGDKITASPISGVGMLATADTQIVGTAQGDLDTKTARTQTITDKTDQRHTVHIGSIPVQASVSYYVAPSNQFLPPFLQNLANSISGRPVSAVRILLCGVLLLLAFSSIFALIYTAVRTGIISLGRNPLAAGAIQHGLVNVGATVLLVAILAVAGVYIILIY